MTNEKGKKVLLKLLGANYLWCYSGFLVRRSWRWRWSMFFNKLVQLDEYSLTVCCVFTWRKSLEHRLCESAELYGNSKEQVEWRSHRDTPPASRHFQMFSWKRRPARPHQNKEMWLWSRKPELRVQTVKHASPFLSIYIWHISAFTSSTKDQHPSAVGCRP